MKTFVLKRKWFGDDFCQGELFLSGEFVAYTLEPRRINWAVESKVKGRTAIPEGLYSLVFTMSSRFGIVLPLLENVPYFEGVRIHAGNYPKHTQGCILLGVKRTHGAVWHSKLAMLNFFDKIDLSETYQIVVE